MKKVDFLGRPLSQSAHRMPIDLTHLNLKNAMDMKFAVRQASAFLAKHESSVCCDESSSLQTIFLDNPDMPRIRLDYMNDLIERILYSSGFLSKFEVKKKNKKGYELTLWMEQMSAEVRMECLGDPFTLQEEDPSSSDMD